MHVLHCHTENGLGGVRRLPRAALRPFPAKKFYQRTGFCASEGFSAFWLHRLWTGRAFFVCLEPGLRETCFVPFGAGILSILWLRCPNHLSWPLNVIDFAPHCLLDAHRAVCSRRDIYARLDKIYYRFSTLALTLPTNRSALSFSRASASSSLYRSHSCSACRTRSARRANSF